jgi:hypothetical protein
MRVLALVIISVLTPSLLGGLLAIRHLDSILKEACPTSVHSHRPTS